MEILAALFFTWLTGTITADVMQNHEDAICQEIKNPTAKQKELCSDTIETAFKKSLVMEELDKNDRRK